MCFITYHFSKELGKLLFYVHEGLGGSSASSVTASTYLLVIDSGIL